MVQNRDNIKLEIIGALIRQPLHVRRIASQLSQSHSTIARALIELEKENAVNSQIVGKNKLYSLKKNLTGKSYIFRAEYYKQGKLLKKYPLLEPILEDLLDKGKENILVLFGSYAKFTPKADSDIDLYIETKNIKLKKELEKINSKLGIKIGELNPESVLIKEIIKNHIILRGVEGFYEKTRFFKEIK
ncbi:MAG TPA: nucleotidyltransferase domain-containing protein [Candidatus Nanoarchaeia archaeon]|nr:nucleotidyltransferase domain-containing protein [Candidatus Nanoarchaeia archaeon]